MTDQKKKPKAVIVGGSIAGVSCAHTLILAGWDVVVVEKSFAAPTGSPTGAGLGLDPLALTLIQSWIKEPELLNKATLPLTIDQNDAIDGEKKVKWTLTRDEDFNCRAAHWADLHALLYNALPPNLFLWGHHFLSFTVSSDKGSVKVKATAHQTNEIFEIVGDLLVAADGCLSSIRQSFVPDHKLRYSGYCAWRGVLDFSGNENSETIIGIRKAYPELGKCLYFGLGSGSHTVLYELLNQRLNWIWYVHQPEPDLKRNSMTTKAGSYVIKNMHKEAEKVWLPEFFGDAAHPTTPHAVRSTNMSVLDAAVLGQCLKKWGAENLQSALEEYQSIRLPVVSKQVLHSRRMGRIKQGLVLPDRPSFDPKTANSEECQELQQRLMPFFSDVPAILL
ncbi:unnamed protein product [Prunus armeniaca]|uniref:FAD-binding domain-containing protein n=1 Tax=Prunus armeniaca TaxID=36596 RepID=A0A6J5TSL1_PRUAR|nr:unnamed protein product [Prunus armeniaca]